MITFSPEKTGSLLNFLTGSLYTRGRIREIKQPRRRRQQEPHKFAYLTMKNSILARFARAFFIF